MVKLQDHRIGFAAVQARMPAQILQDLSPVPQPESLPVLAPSFFVPGIPEPVDRLPAGPAVRLQPVAALAVPVEFRHTQGTLATRTELPRASARSDRRLPPFCREIFSFGWFRIEECPRPLLASSITDESPKTGEGCVELYENTGKKIALRSGAFLRPLHKPYGNNDLDFSGTTRPAALVVARASRPWARPRRPCYEQCQGRQDKPACLGLPN